MTERSVSAIQMVIEKLEIKLPLIIRPSKWVFITVFLLTFLLSGIITMLDIIPYRMGLASLLVTPLFLLYGLKIDKVFLSYGLLIIFIALSAIYNDSPFMQMLLFFRIIIFSYFIYFLVKVFVKEKNIETIIKIIILIGIIQLPVILLQTNTYDLLPGRITQGMNLWVVDYDFGTFNFKGDNSMAYFLLILIIYLLFNQNKRPIIPYSGAVVIWLTLTILIANSEISKILLAFVWGIFFLTRINKPSTWLLFLGLVLVMFGLGASGILSELIESVARPLQKPIDVLILGKSVEARVNIYLNGGYSRSGAIYYYTFIEDVLWFGDGPSIYSNALTKENVRGNVGHIFTFYSEVGMFALLLSYLIFWQIMFPMRNWRIRFSLTRVLIFSSLLVMSFTTQIMNDISVVLIYCLIAKMHLLDQNQPTTLGEATHV
jgi:hypothetical protein